MNIALEDWKKQEAERIQADARAWLEYRADREKRLSPAFETARFIGFSGDMPTNLPLATDTALANFVGKDGTQFSLFLDRKNDEKLTENHDYFVGFTPMLLDEHKTPTAMQFFINAMMRPSPIMGEFVFARAPGSKLRERSPSKF